MRHSGVMAWLRRGGVALGILCGVWIVQTAGISGEPAEGAEIRALWARGHGPELSPLDSVGYREMGAYIRGEMGFEAAFDAFTRATRRLAKRQMTWWRSDPTVEWFHPDRDGDAIMARAAAWLTPSCPSATSTSSGPSPR